MLVVSCDNVLFFSLGGTNTGVMKRVGEAVKHRGSVAANMNRSKINVIGIAPWGVLEEPHKLVSVRNNRPLSYESDMKVLKRCLK